MKSVLDIIKDTMDFREVLGEWASSKKREVDIEATYKVEWAKAYLEGDSGTQKDRSSRADIATGKLGRDLALAKLRTQALNYLLLHIRDGDGDVSQENALSTLEEDVSDLESSSPTGSAEGPQQRGNVLRTARRSPSGLPGRGGASPPQAVPRLRSTLR